MAHVVVVGGGITGLAAAFELTQQAEPPAVTVLEASDRCSPEGPIALMTEIIE